MHLVQQKTEWPEHDESVVVFQYVRTRSSIHCEVAQDEHFLFVVVTELNHHRELFEGQAEAQIEYLNVSPEYGIVCQISQRTIR